MISILKFNMSMIALLGLGMVLKSALAKFGVDTSIYFLTVLIMLFNCTIFFIRPKFINKNVLWCMGFLFCGLLSLLYSLLNGLAQISLPGFVLAYLYFIFWLVIYSNLNDGEGVVLFNKYVKIQLYLAVLSAILAIYQFFFDQTLFDLCVYKYYVNAEEYIGHDISNRATALIGSPQNLGAYMAMMCQSIFFLDYTLYKKVFLYVLFFLGGVLSGSGIFVGMTLIFLLIYSFKRNSSLVFKVFRVFIVLLVTLLIFAHFTSETPFFIDSALDLGTDLLYGDRLDVYKLDVVFRHHSWMEVLFGNGVGIADQGVERFLNYSNDVVCADSESYLLKLFYEQGTLASIAFILLYFKATYGTYKSTHRYAYTIFAMLLSALPNLLFTPSFAGFTMSFMFWPFILFSLTLEDQRKKNNFLENKNLII